MTQHRSNQKMSGTFVSLDATGMIPSELIPSVESASAVTEVEIDLGSVPVYSKSVTVTAASCTASTNVMVSPSANPATGRGTDDNLWDGLILSAQPGTGSFTLHVIAVPGPVSGKRNINYQLGT